MIPSLPKLLGLVVVIWMVWTVFRIYETWQAKNRTKQTEDGDESQHNTPHGAAGRGSSNADHSVDLRECKFCQAWVSGDNCGREHCPY